MSQLPHGRGQLSDGAAYDTSLDERRRWNELEQRWKLGRVRTTSGTAFLGELVRVDTTSASVTITLPKATNCQNHRVGVKWTEGSNPLTVAAASGETIDGSSGYVLAGVGDFYIFFSDGEGWIIV